MYEGMKGLYQVDTNGGAYLYYVDGNACWFLDYEPTDQEIEWYIKCVNDGTIMKCTNGTMEETEKVFGTSCGYSRIAY